MNARHRKYPPQVGNFRHVGKVAAEVAADLRFQRRVERVHALGPRATAELLAELGAERSIMTLIDQKLGSYAELDPEVLKVAGGDDFWPAPLYEVQPSPEPPDRPANALSRATQPQD